MQKSFLPLSVSYNCFNCHFIKSWYTTFCYFEVTSSFSAVEGWKSQPQTESRETMLVKHVSQPAIKHHQPSKFVEITHPWHTRPCIYTSSETYTCKLHLWYAQTSLGLTRRKSEEQSEKSSSLTWPKPDQWHPPLASAVVYSFVPSTTETFGFSSVDGNILRQAS